MSEGGRESFEARPTAGDPAADVDRTDALSERLFGNALGALELYTIDLGERLGLDRSLAESGAGHVVAAGRTHRNYRAVRAGVARAPRRE
jgi:hypothetical protein